MQSATAVVVDHGGLLTNLTKNSTTTQSRVVHTGTSISTTTASINFPVTNTTSPVYSVLAKSGSRPILTPSSHSALSETKTHAMDATFSEAITDSVTERKTTTPEPVSSSRAVNTAPSSPIRSSVALQTLTQKKPASEVQSLQGTSKNLSVSSSASTVSSSVSKVVAHSQGVTSSSKAIHTSSTIPLSSKGHQTTTTTTATSASLTTPPVSITDGPTVVVPAVIANPKPTSGALSDDSNPSNGLSFLSRKGAAAGVFTAVGIVALFVVAVFMFHSRRKKQVRRREFAATVYTNTMSQRRSYYDPDIPAFVEVARLPPIPPCRRPVPEYGDSFSSLTYGIEVPMTYTGMGTYSARRSPTSAISSPFTDGGPSPSSDMPLLYRQLRSGSQESHEDKLSSPPSPTPSTPSLYPPTLPPLEDGSVIGHPSRRSLSEGHSTVLDTDNIRSVYRTTEYFVSSPLARG